ncbi:MAG: fibronectin type III domain-containing protein [Bacteroidota bacterium]
MLRKILFLSAAVFMLVSGASSQVIWPSGLSGRWTFDSINNPCHATSGTDLIPVGFSIPIAGPSTTDKAIRLGVGSFFHCIHNIPANGSGSPTKVNRYTLLIDFRINQFGMWRTFFQTDSTNNVSNDGEVFINPAGNIGVGVTGYSSYVLKAGEWYRMVISADLGNHFDYYLDGKLLMNGGAQTADGRFSLNPAGGLNEVLLFADNDGEDHVIDIAQVAIFNRSLPATTIDSLGGFGHNLSSWAEGINAYLQTPTPTSIYVSWHSAQTTSTIVEYGTTAQLGASTAGSFEIIGTKNWHTVKLTGLNPDTHYFYRCISGSDTSQVYEFRTPFAAGSNAKHLRFVMTGDSQSDVNMPAIESNEIEEKFKELYGTAWIDSIAFFLRVGDITGDGTQSDLYEKEYFNPFGNLTHAIPSMTTIGNHEGGSNYYYQYMKYEDVSDYSYPDPLAERYYSFSLGNCQFIALNTNPVYQNSLQQSWLHNKLAQSDTSTVTDFVFTYNHHPFHSEMWPDGNTAWTGSGVYSELVNFPKVMLNCYGHSHNYERGVIKSEHGQPQDFRIMCIGGGGAYLDRWGMYPNQTDYPEIQSMYDHYSYVIVDVDIDAKSYTATTYSLGNPDKRLNNIPLETFHYRANQPPPQKPVAVNTMGGTPFVFFEASAFSGADSLMSSQFQLTDTSGNWSSPIVDTIRDKHDIYGNSGSPDFTAVDLNAGIDLESIYIPGTNLIPYSNYFWRVRYRDENIKWSEWSDESQFTYFPEGMNNDIALAGNIVIAPNPLTEKTKIYFENCEAGLIHVEIRDINGKIANEINTFNPTNGPFEMAITIDDKGIAAPGLYFCRIIRNNNVITQKLVKLQ